MAYKNFAEWAKGGSKSVTNGVDESAVLKSNAEYPQLAIMNLMKSLYTTLGEAFSLFTKSVIREALNVDSNALTDLNNAASAIQEKINKFNAFQNALVKFGSENYPVEQALAKVKTWCRVVDNYVFESNVLIFGLIENGYWTENKQAKVRLLYKLLVGVVPGDISLVKKFYGDCVLLNAVHTSVMRKTKNIIGHIIEESAALESDESDYEYNWISLTQFNMNMSSNELKRK